MKWDHEAFGVRVGRESSELEGKGEGSQFYQEAWEGWCVSRKELAAQTPSAVSYLETVSQESSDA